MDVERLKRINMKINWVMVVVSACTLTFMALMTSLDVFLRYVFNSPLPASVEISQLLEPWVIFLPFAYTLAMDRHVRVSLVTMRLPRKARLASDLFSLLVGFVLFLALTFFSWGDFYQSWSINEIMMAAIILPWWAGKLAMPIGMVLLAIQCVVSAILTVHKYFNPPEHEEIVLPAV